METGWILSLSAARVPFLYAPSTRLKRRRTLCESVKAAKRENGSAVRPEWRDVGLRLFGTGFVLGPLLDCIHSRVELQVYDNWAVNLGDLHTNVWVFPILGTFYCVIGLVQLALDAKFSTDKSVRAPSSRKLALCLLYLTLFLELSAELYKANVPYNVEAYVLFAAAQLNWVLFESTWHGFALASLVGVLCPLLEVPIIKWFHLWHYSKPNLFILDEGVVTWVICCYFAYTPFIANLTRWLTNKELKNL